MSSYSAENLYALLPALYRQRDAEQGHPLRALVEILSEQAQAVERDILQLYDNWFVETCEPWVVPYLADLVGVSGLSGEELRRSEVANTLAWRQRKGTPAVLEQLARDATGWTARAVPFFERVATTQHASHLRPAKRTIDLRHGIESLDGPFDATTRTADARRGRVNLPSVGLYLWRLTAYPRVRFVPASISSDNRVFAFHPLGHNRQLFGAQIPAPISLRSFAGSNSLAVWDDTGRLLPADEIVACDLTTFPKAVPDGKVAIDPVLGRVQFPKNQDPTRVRLTCHYGFSADLGGGPYEREASFPRIADERVFRVGGADGFGTLPEALAAWGGSGSAVIEIRDSLTYRQQLTIHIPEDTRLEIRAANEEHPTLNHGMTVTGEERSRFEINGLLISGELRTLGSLQGLAIRHSTLVPGQARLDVRSPTTEILIDHSITGAIVTGADAQIAAVDSILDAGRRNREVFNGGLLSLSRATVIGNVIARELPRVEDTLFLGERVTAARRQQGIVRFSCVPPGAQTPRRYRTTQAAPRLTSLTWGHPGYCQLAAGTADEIRRGASDGSEMGAFASLRQPQREEYLRGRLEDHLPAGLEAEILFAT